jgi:DNA-binding NarL/FixJ family response regulator
MGYQDVTEGALAKSSLRATKFTPERIQQIKDLIASGTSCEEIAALIGVTAGTLKVTCSKLATRRDVGKSTFRGPLRCLRGQRSAK